MSAIKEMPCVTVEQVSRLREMAIKIESELEQLKREQAMLVEKLGEAINLIHAIDGRDNSCNPTEDISDLRDALSATEQRATQWQEQKKAESLEELATYFEKQDWRNWETGKFVEDEIHNKASELRLAASKREQKEEVSK